MSSKAAHGVDIAQRILSSNPPPGLSSLDVLNWFGAARVQLEATLADALGEVRRPDQIHGISLIELQEHGTPESWYAAGRAFAEEAVADWGDRAGDEALIERTTLEALDAERALTAAERAELRAGITSVLAPDAPSPDTLLRAQDFTTIDGRRIRREVHEGRSEWTGTLPSGAPFVTRKKRTAAAVKPPAETKPPEVEPLDAETVQLVKASHKGDIFLAAANLRAALDAIEWALPRFSHVDQDRPHLDYVFSPDGKRLWATDGVCAASWRLDPEPGVPFALPADAAVALRQALNPSFRIVRVQSTSNASVQVEMQYRPGPHQTTASSAGPTLAGRWSTVGEYQTDPHWQGPDVRDVAQDKAKPPRLLRLSKPDAMPRLHEWLKELTAAGGQEARRTRIEIVPEDACSTAGTCEVRVRASVTVIKGAKALEVKKTAAQDGQVVYDADGVAWTVRRSPGSKRPTLRRVKDGTTVWSRAEQERSTWNQTYYSRELERREVSVRLDTRGPLDATTETGGMQPILFVEAMRHAPGPDVEVSLVRTEAWPYRIDSGPYTALVMPLRGL